MKTDVSKLAKTLIKEYKLEKSNDTLSKWMLCYISEQIIKIEKSTGQEKEIAENKCFNTILELWKHRSSVPNENNPIKKFEQIIDLLDELNPKNENPFYSKFLSNSSADVSEDEVTELVTYIKILDEAVKIWINELLSEASKKATNENIKTIIQNFKDTSPFSPSKDISVIVKLMEIGINGEEDEKKAIKQNVLEIQTKIEKLENFNQLNKTLLNIFTTQMEEFENIINGETEV